MSDMQQYTCPVCDARGAHPKSMPAPKCHWCEHEVLMKKSNNGVIIEEYDNGVQPAVVDAVEDGVQRVMDQIIDGSDPDSIMRTLDRILKTVGSKKTAKELMIY